MRRDKERWLNDVMPWVSRSLVTHMVTESLSIWQRIYVIHGQGFNALWLLWRREASSCASLPSPRLPPSLLIVCVCCSCLLWDRHVNLRVNNNSRLIRLNQRNRIFEHFKTLCRFEASDGSRICQGRQPNCYKNCKIMTNFFPRRGRIQICRQIDESYKSNF